uniref:Peptidase A2 domain-containing protein n=1 Tax=Mastacembelus armatus TaxID=205130 RepID=A0A3Q3KJT8_9TELE
MLKINGVKIKFLCDTGADRTVLRDKVPGVTKGDKNIFVKSANGQVTPCSFSQSFVIEDEASGFQEKVMAVLCPNCPVNLLGRDLLSKLKISLFEKLGPQRITLKTLYTDRKGKAVCSVSLPSKAKRLLMGWSPNPHLSVSKTNDMHWEELKQPRIKQYPLKPDALQGIRPVVQEMLDAGILVRAPEAQCNTPIFPVKKADGRSWRMIQDLREVNKAVESRAPCVPDPLTLLNHIKPEIKWFNKTVNTTCSQQRGFQFGIQLQKLRIRTYQVSSCRHATGCVNTDYV